MPTTFVLCPRLPYVHHTPSSFAPTTVVLPPIMPTYLGVGYSCLMPYLMSMPTIPLLLSHEGPHDAPTNHHQPYLSPRLLLSSPPYDLCPLLSSCVHYRVQKVGGSKKKRAAVRMRSSHCKASKPTRNQNKSMTQ